MNPKTITDFRRLGKRRLNGRTPEEAKALHDQRVRATKNRKQQTRRACVGIAAWVRDGQPLPNPRRVRAIPLGGHRIQPRIYKRARNWNHPQATVRHTQHEAVDCGRYSSNCTYTRWEYNQFVESWGHVANGVLHYRIDTDAGLVRGTLRPWKGWHWIIDANGIALVDGKGKRDHHPTAFQLLNNTMAELAEEARHHNRLRIDSKKLKATRKREAERYNRLIREAERTEGFAVSIVDSVRAGNCQAGTHTWAVRHGLDPDRHYRPSKLLAVCNGDAKLVALVVSVALRRHQHEVKAGVAQLSDHYLQ